MARSSSLAWWFTLTALFCAAAAAGWSSDDPNPIRMVTGELREVEAQVVRVIGRTQRALSFARFAHRYGKRYESPEELKLRFQLFSENMRLIRSSNNKRLPYTLAVNRMCFFLLFMLFFFYFFFSSPFCIFLCFPLMVSWWYLLPLDCDYWCVCVIGRSRRFVRVAFGVWLIGCLVFSFG